MGRVCCLDCIVRPNHHICQHAALDMPNATISLTTADFAQRCEMVVVVFVKQHLVIMQLLI